MNNNFRGWTSVYGFTLSQSTKGVGFKVITTLISLLLIGAFITINLVVAKPENKYKEEVSPIHTVYVLDNSGLEQTNYKDMISQLEDKKFSHIEFMNTVNKSSEEVVKTAGARSSESIAVVISRKDSGYEIQAIIPEGSNISKKQAEDLLQVMSSGFESNKLMQAGLSVEQLMGVLKPSVVSFAEIGESTSEITKAIKVVAPMIFSFVMYFMLLIYGQTMSKSVSTEKTSKLMEVLLTSIHPYAMITGKVLAVTTMALGQFITWIASAILGLYGGNAIAQRIYPEYESSAITIINFLKDNIGETAMTTPAVLLAIVFFCLGFLFYSIIAAVAGCMVSKPEDVASTQAVFQMPVIISWLISYFGPMLGNEGLALAARYIPLTSPFSVPAELITGTIGLPEGLLSTSILLVFCLLTIMFAARLYKGLVLYNGQKLSFKVIGSILKTSK